MGKTRMIVRSIKSVGLVDAGACEGADIVLFKRGESLNSQAAPVAADQDLIDELTKRGAKMAAERQAKFKAALDQIAAVFAEVANDNGGNMAKDNAEKKDASTESVTRISIVEGGVAEETAKRFEDLEKRAADAEKRAADAETAAKAATDAAAAEKDARLTTEFVQKARDLNIAGTKPEEFGLVLKSIHGALPPEIADTIERTFKALSEQVAKGDLFAEIGKSQSADSAAAKIEAIAKDLVTKGEVTNLVVGRVEARKRNRELAEQEKAERA